MASKNGKNTTLFILTREDVVQMVKQLHPEIDAEKVVANGDFLHQVKKGLEWGLECWGDEVMKTAIEDAMPNTNRQSRLSLN